MSKIRLNLNKFDELCTKMGMSEREVARRGEFSVGLISQIRLAGGSTSRNTLKKIADVLKVAVDYLMESDEPPSSMSTIPVFSDWAIAGQPNPNSFITQWIKVDSVNSACIGLRVKGDSMSPYFLENDLIILCKDIKPQSGDFVVIKLMTEPEPTLKEIFIYEDRWALRPLNPLYTEVILEKRDFNLIDNIWVVVKSIRETIRRKL